jgi:hypothetical protein
MRCQSKPGVKQFAEKLRLPDISRRLAPLRARYAFLFLDGISN